MLQSGDADVGIVSEKLMTEEQLAAFPYYHWHHAVLVPEEHELTRAPELTLETLSRYPLITSDTALPAVRGWVWPFRRQGCSRKS